MSAKKNHRRAGQKKPGEYNHIMMQTRLNAGLGYSGHSGGRRGAARDVRAMKVAARRQERRQLNKLDYSS